MKEICIILLLNPYSFFFFFFLLLMFIFHAAVLVFMFCIIRTVAFELEAHLIVKESLAIGGSFFTVISSCFSLCSATFLIFALWVVIIHSLSLVEHILRDSSFVLIYGLPLWKDQLHSPAVFSSILWTNCWFFFFNICNDTRLLKFRLIWLSIRFLDVLMWMWDQANNLACLFYILFQKSV